MRRRSPAVRIIRTGEGWAMWLVGSARPPPRAARVAGSAEEV